MPDKFRNKFMQLCCLTGGTHIYIHKYESNASMLSRVIFYLKSVHFFFLFSMQSKTGVYRGIHFFLIFALKHRSWVLVRTA